MWYKIVVLVLLGAILVGVCGCGKTNVEFFAFLEENFCAQVNGRVGESEVVATVTAERTVEGWEVTVEYLAPPALEGVRVTGTCRADGALTGESEVTRGAQTVTLSATAAKGLLLPVTAWLDMGEYLTAEREGDDYRLCYEDHTLIVTSEKIPRQYRSESAEFWIVWWEKAVKKAK